MKLTTAQKDRAAGVLLGMACGDALGAGYEFGPPLHADTPVSMKGGTGFGWAPGEWTDDTSMAVPLARAAAAGLDLRDEAVLDGIVAQWVGWARTAPDVGIQLRAVLSRTEPTASAVRVVAKAHHDRNGRSAGNGSLMRTAPVALAYLDDPAALAEAARLVSDLTHYETDAGDACVLWCLAIRHAVLEGDLDVRVGLPALPADRRGLWESRFAVAETSLPSHFARNGWVVEALQGAWSAISHTEATDATHLRLALETAVRGGRDTDTVAAIAGGLLGARWGASAVPAPWRRIVHGWPGLDVQDLVRLGARASGDQHAIADAAAQRHDYAYLGDVSTLVRHPHDDHIWLGAAGALDTLPDDIDAVVSLCRVGTEQVPARIRHRLEVRLIDKDDPAQNPNLDVVLLDTVNALAALRAEGHTVLLHCAQAESRTPSVAALYAARHRAVPIKRAIADVIAVLPAAAPKRFLREAITRLSATDHAAAAPTAAAAPLTTTTEE
ncbi:ADP-ribosylglycohydrolase family protein [Cryobacterium sp. MDB1-18-2]|uniref:ADP-ribosylglycohydrolase family protein n=1 Tax=unclassified Cryobacterium TaxID=2649013 RepID=UPI00106BA169|nr:MULTISPECIES: ADP-ribosylglycohydrolase family protein [unclassified Cryobacterium]TFC33159.1 ADP-ribosylglycohydrolase family protein [Cryobacterium sp. MDB1-18-2]TFC37014.1 ADP-ribosylglycohydrolase family protein [Cryobacterium sp. MDB1-18-1]